MITLVVRKNKEINSGIEKISIQFTSEELQRLNNEITIFTFEVDKDYKFIRDENKSDFYTMTIDKKTYFISVTINFKDYPTSKHSHLIHDFFIFGFGETRQWAVKQLKNKLNKKADEVLKKSNALRMEYYETHNYLINNKFF